MKVSRKSFLSSQLFYIFVSANEINPDPEKRTKSKPKKDRTKIHEKPTKSNQSEEKPGSAKSESPKKPRSKSKLKNQVRQILRKTNNPEIL